MFASESGNCERLAGDLAKIARKNGLKPALVDMADLDVAMLASVKRLVVIAATWGEGEPPARAAHAYAELMGDKAPRLEGVEFGVLALGDTAYVGILRHRQGDRRATRGAGRQSASSTASIAISISPSPPPIGSTTR